MSRKGRVIMKHIYFVDFENVGKSFIKGAEYLTIEDEVYLFHYTFRKAIPQDVKDALFGIKAKKKVIELNIHTKNAMDFQICTCLGYMLHDKGTAAEYYIVSGDLGYQASIDYIKRNVSENVKLAQISSFEEIRETGNIKEELSKILALYSKKVIRVAAEGIGNTKTEHEYHNYLQKNLNKDATAVFAKTRELYNRLREAEYAKEKAFEEYVKSGETKTKKIREERENRIREEKAQEIYSKIMDLNLLSEETAREVTGIDKVR